MKTRWILMGLLVAGCGSGSEPNSAPRAARASGEGAHRHSAVSETAVTRRPAAIQVVPGDLMTATGGLNPTLILGTREVTEETAHRLAVAARLVHWPDRTPVEASWSYAAPDTVEHVNSGEIEIVPAEPLEAGWYAVLVDTRGVEGFVGTGQQIEPDLWATRFRPDSFPTVRSIGVGLGDGGTGSIRVELSERIDESTPATELVLARTSRGPLACEPAGHGVATIHGGTVIELICPRLEADTPLTLEIAPAASRLGIRLPFALDGSTVTFVPSDGVPSADVDALFVPTGEAVLP